MGIFSAKMTLKDRYWFGGFSGTPPSEPNLSTPPPPRVDPMQRVHRGRTQSGSKYDPEFCQLFRRLDK